MTNPNVPNIILPYLPQNTIVPNPAEEPEIFIQYFNRLYEDIAYNVNNRDNKAFLITITSEYQNIPNVPNSGAYIILVNGVSSEMPCSIFILTKASNTAVGVFSTVQYDLGNGTLWGGKQLEVDCTATNFRIRHNLVDTPIVAGSFYLRIVGTL